MRLLLPLLIACTPAASGPGGPGGPEDTGTDDTGDGDETADTGETADSGDTADTAETASRCTRTGAVLSCAHHTWTVTVAGEDRDVHWQVPAGPAPAAGHPAVVLYQGTALPAARFWSAREDDAYGLWHQVRTTEALLDAGYAVLTPDARGDGDLYWDTNQWPYNVSWTDAPDHDLVLALLAAIADGTFGGIDASRLAAGGFSSGGYMTSRMAVSHAGAFQALVIVSASYATCAGAWCAVPAELPSDHPPTLFLHGESDTIVPWWTAEAYVEGLRDHEVPVEVVLDAEAGHEWLEEAPQAVVDWVDARI